MPGSLILQGMVFDDLSWSDSEESLGYESRFSAERAVSPVDGSLRWVVLDPSLVIHAEGTDFCWGLYGADRSPNTIRVYAGRTAVFLGWCSAGGVDWKTVGLGELARFKAWLEMTPSRSGYRKAGTVDAILIAVCEFLRFCARTGRIDSRVADQLVELRWLAFLPAGFDRGERGQFRTVRVRQVRARAQTVFPEALSPEQSNVVFTACRRPREVFIVCLLHDSGLRIGEALGLRREDMHLLPDSRSLGCAVVGAHLHVRRRANPNGTLAKSRYPRMVPASEAILSAYADYAFERDAILGDDDSDFVLVNLYHTPLGKPMTYRGAKGLFERLAGQTGFPLRPHMFRHTAATNWVRAGVDVDVVQRLLGHAVPASTLVYLHARDEDRRRAVEAVAAGELYR